MKFSTVTFRLTLVLLTLLMIPSLSFGLGVGDQAPLFGEDSTQGFIQLADYLGNKNVVLALYFAVFTPV